jgi:proteasome assembly chaperone (PAC2) family protein
MSALVLQRAPGLRRPVLLLAFTGWNDAGQAATSALRFVAEQLSATPFARVDPDEFYDFTVLRPQVRLVEGTQRTIDWNTVEVRGASVPVVAHDFAFGWGPEPHLKWKAFCTLMLDLVRECGASIVVTLGAYLAEVLYSRPVPVTGFATDPELVRRVDVGATRYEGPTGIIGVLADQCRAAGLRHVSLWAALPHYIAATPNPRGSLALLLRVAELVQLPIDLQPLQEAAAAFEQQVTEAINSDPKLSAYVRELKRREFAN